ncbi:MAG TPA: hypothetical protein VG916_01835, partial [Gemmatimonadaceae bacterium]|nr:hypothetical protein [Gemmatimonadaceae bacterium]
AATQDPRARVARDTNPATPNTGGGPVAAGTATAGASGAATAVRKAGGRGARGKASGASGGSRPTKPDTNSEAYRDSVLNAMWPVKGPAPLPGAIFPSKRVVAFYGNILNTKMGVLGEYEPDEMLRRLDAEVKAWEEADPSLPVQPALHFIAVVAQGSAGKDGKYRARMDSSVIERVASLARRRDALVFLDVQVGLSTLRDELPRLVPFLMRPNFHLGIDPEFSMKDGTPPGRKVGTYDAADVNYAAGLLADLVTKYNLPPKILVVHRFTQRGLTNYRDIKLDPRVQIVIDMDGFGPPQLKKGTFRNYIKAEPVQFVGWKQFFKSRNDNPRTTIAEILKLWPRPLYIQYQ